MYNATNLHTNIIYLTNECIPFKTRQRENLNLNNKICKVYIKGKNEWIFFKMVAETATTFSGIRIQQDQYDNNKFYLTDEKNKWHGLVANQAFSKGRWIYVYN